MMMQAYRLVSFLGAVGMALALSACDVSTPSQVQTGKIRVGERVVTETLDAAKVDPLRVKIVSSDIQRNGRGAVTITVPYLEGGEAAARKQGAAYRKAFEGQGVKKVALALVPVTDDRVAGQVVVDYRAVVAAPAEKCTRIPGYVGADNLEEAVNYRFGCEMQALTTKMVADPTDLLGKESAQGGSSRRSGAIIEGYQSGTPQQPLDGMNASQVGNQ